MNNKTKDFLYNSSIILFVISLIMFFITVYNYRLVLDGDMSYELILGNVLAGENKWFVTNSWFYSTNLRVLDIQFVYGLLFRIFHKWIYVRFFAIILVNCTFLLLIYYLCSLLEMKNMFFILASSYLFPICYDVIWFYQLGLWYLIYVIYFICIICLFLNWFKYKSYICLFLSFILSVVFCLEGSRIIAVVYIPLLIANLAYMIISKKYDKKIMIFSLIIFAGSLIGFIINKEVLLKILPNNYSVSITKIEFNSSSEFYKNLFNFIFFGDKNNIILNIFSFIIVIFSFICSFNNLIHHNKPFLTIFSIFYIALFAIVCLTGILTNVGVRQRYILQATIYTLPIIIFSIVCNLYKKPTFFITLLIIAFISLSINTYIILFSIKNNNNQLEYITNFLLDNGYLNGYSTYNDSPIITEFSNGKIDVWNWGDIYHIEDSFTDIDRVLPLLQKTDHYNNRPKGKCFIVLNSYYRDKLKDLQWNFVEDDILCEEDDYIVYGFDSVQELYNKINN